MSNRNGKGPGDRGSRTGAQMGKCAGSQNVPFEQKGPTRGCGQKRGLGNSRRHKQGACLSANQNNNEETKS